VVYSFNKGQISRICQKIVKSGNNPKPGGLGGVPKGGEKSKKSCPELSGGHFFIKKHEILSGDL
jgi:hypothetical protein